VNIHCINILTLISERDEFGINTDIFETNILNLSVVIGVLVYYGKAVFSTWNLEAWIQKIKSLEKNFKLITFFKIYKV